MRMMQNIESLVIVTSDKAQPDEVSFTIYGPPIAQNGWKLAWRNRRQPVLYDSLQKHKADVRANICRAFRELEHHSFPVFDNVYIQVDLTFNLHHITSKDVDNMMKYILDAMQDALYRNDAFIMAAIVKKERVSNVEDVESTLVKISRLPSSANTDRRDDVDHGVYVYV